MGDLGCNNYRNMEKRKSCKITNMIRVKGSERRPFIFIFRLNIVLPSSYQVDEIFMEIDEWKLKVSLYFKSFSRVLLGCVGDINCILKKLYYMNFTSVAAV